MAFTKVNHVGMLTSDLEEGRRVFCDGWGLAVDEHRTPWPEGRPGTLPGTTAVHVPIGEMYLEVARPDDGSSAAAQFVAERRAGMYYIAIASNDLEVDVRGLEQRGARIDGDWRGRGVFLDPESTLGLRIQIVPDTGYYTHPYYLGDGTFTGMAHVGIAARDPEEVHRLFGDVFALREDRSAERGGRETNPQPRGSARPADDPVYLMEYPLGGTVLEISVPTTDDSGTARLVQNRAPLGAAWHHLCPFAPDVYRATERGLAAGLQQIGELPPQVEDAAEEGAARPARTLVSWFHPRTCLGTLIEIWNRPPGKEHAVQWQRLDQP